MPAAEVRARAVIPAEAAGLFAVLEPFAHVAVAVSGGRDSMALLRLLGTWSLARGGRPDITALTVDHGLRPGSRGEAERVADWCARLSIAHHVLHWTGEKPATRIEERARDARYALLTAWCAANGAGALALAHHLEDQAETVLMRLARSSGTDGLAGMAAFSLRDGVPIIRPLLAISRDRLAATLAAPGQDWIDDPSNDDPAFERVRLRGLRPALDAAGLTPAAIAGSAAKLARAAQALDEIAGRAFAGAVTVEPGGYAWIDRDGLASWPDEIVQRVLRRAIGVVGGAGRLGDGSLARAAFRLAAPNFAAFTLGRCRLSQARAGILLAREPRRLPQCGLAPGATLVWDGRFAVSLQPGERAVDVAPLGRAHFAAARALNPALCAIPPTAGAVMPGGFRAGALALAPSIAPAIDEAGDGARLAVRFLGRAESHAGG